MLVVYSPGNRDYSSAYQPAFASQHADAESSLPRNLFIAVAVLGMATYGFSFGPVAALCAAIGLLAKQKPLSLATAVLAAMGFLDALSDVMTDTDRGWALTVIVVLNGLQALAALGALVLAPKAAPEPGDAASYQAYVDYYNQAIRSYYGQQAQSVSPDQSQRAGYGQAYADGRATQRAQRSQRPSQHGDYADLDYSGTRTTGPRHDPAGSTADPTGLPSFGQARTRADHQVREAEGSTRPSSPG
jgi:hypothetical protein